MIAEHESRPTGCRHFSVRNEVAVANQHGRGESEGPLVKIHERGALSRPQSGPHGGERHVVSVGVCLFYPWAMDIRLDNRVIIVTGASRGIGLATAQLAVQSGARVVLTSRKQSNLDEAVASFGDAQSQVLAVEAHAGRSADADRVMATTLEHFGRIDGLVNNAATNPYYGPLVDIDDARMAKTVETNQSSIVYHSRAAWHAAFAEHGGVIVNVASVGGLGPEPGIGWYNVTKAAVIHLTRQLSWELAPRVRVNAVAPGLVRTELARGLWEERGEEIASQIPLRRLGDVSDIAESIVFLLSDAASWITGQTLVVDGGTTTQPSGGVG